MTCLKSRTNLITYGCIKYTSPLTMFISIIVVKDTDFIGTLKSNYRTNEVMMMFALY
jgi:hypothetical protein